ncbi:MAG: alpha/beta fold hydrolase BchO [Pseudomonadota bacterium]
MAVRLDAATPARPGQPDWSVKGKTWPNSDHSEFWRLDRTAWHIQRAGDGPVALLIHGTGAATHSWAGLLPRLAETHAVIAMDLPGQGFTRPAPGFIPSLDQMTQAVGALLRALDIQPCVAIGHSAGAAIALRLTAKGYILPSALVSLNGALRPFPGIMRHLAPGIAKTLTFGGVAANVFANAARDRRRVERLLEQTGGAPDDTYIGHYQGLLECSAHVSSTLSMMANWDLSGIERDLGALDVPIRFIAGANDQAISPAEAPRLAQLAQSGTAVRLTGLGHLAHEQDPAEVMIAIDDILRHTSPAT